MAWCRDFSQKLLQVTNGRTTAFFIAFFIAGHVIFCFGKLTPNYIYYMATLGGLVLGHSVKEDIFARKNPEAGGPDADK